MTKLEKIQEKLKEKLGYSLMVNHDSIEVSDKIFGRGTPAQKELNKIIRKGAFDTAIKYIATVPKSEINVDTAPLSVSILGGAYVYSRTSL